MSLHRRDFLQQSALAGAAALGASALSASALRAAESPNQKVTLAVMGVNGRGSALAKGFASMPGCEVTYVCDPDTRATAKAARLITELGKPEPKILLDFREALDDAKLDALVIGAPDHWHAPATILGCAAGKHVYVEKPACHNPREGELMVQAARENKRHVQLGTQRRSSPQIQKVIELIHGGEIGNCLMARGWINSTRPNIGRGKSAPVPEWLNYDLWQGPAPEMAFRDNLIHYNWHWFWNWGTGELGNNGIHALDVCRWGLDVDKPEFVTCGGGKLFFDDDQETPDTQIATFHFGDKIINWEHRTWNRRGFENSAFGIVFYGDKGSLTMADSNYVVYEIDGKERSRGPISTGNNEHLSNFIDAIRSDQPLAAEIETGVASTLLCHLGNIAYRTGRTLKTDPATGHIQNDAEAAKLWSREYRKGWEPKV